MNDASDRSVVVCEVKTILSAGYSKDHGALVSTMDPKLYEKFGTETETMSATAFVYDIDLRDMETGTSNAVVKYRALLKDRLPVLLGLLSEFGVQGLRRPALGQRQRSTLERDRLDDGRPDASRPASG